MPLSRIVSIVLVVGALALAGVADAQQTYRVGSTPTGVPFTFLDTKTNSIQGVMVDVIRAVAKDQGFNVDIQGMPFSTLIPSLQGNKIDVISAAMYITPQRKEVVDFSEPVYAYGEGLVVSAKDPKDYKTLEDLKGEVVGGQVGTAYVDGLRKTGVFKEVKVYDSLADVLRDVNLGRLKAGFGDFPILAYQIGLGSYPDVKLVKAYKPLMPGSIGIGVRKGNQALLDRVNKAVAKLKSDGTIDRILEQWKLK